jgi:PAS domain S-box-containing protein
VNSRHSASGPRLFQPGSTAAQLVGTRRERIAVGATAALWLGLVAWSGYLVLFADAPNFDALYVLGALLLCALAALAVMMYHGRQQALDYRMKGLRFRTLVQTAQDLIWAVDADGRWAYVNDAARRIYGYEPDELVGRRYKDILAPGEEKKLREVFEQTENGVPVHRQTVHLRKDGKKVRLLYHATIMRDEKGRVLGTMGTATDVTHLHKMQETMLLNERLRAIATLGGGLAHDFNNLLTVIIGQAQVAKQKDDLPLQLKRRLNSILDSAERARKLTAQLVAFAGHRPDRSEVIDLVAVVRQMRDLVRGLAGDDVRVEEILSSEPVRVRADWGQVEQVIMNLVVNARDAMPRGGCITVTVKHRRYEPKEARTLGLKSRDWAVLKVRDEGVGMDEHTRDHIFEPFFTTKGPGKGTGLGLATVHSVVHNHDGRIAVESSPGKGTCMRVFLPPASEEAEREAQKALLKSPAVP